jgi:DNA-binding LacI/PurR family transcriptional regulator
VSSPPPGRATLEDVAARAGVSRATASRVVTGAGRVAAGTRRAVEDAVEALGYTPHQAARSLAASRTDTIALVVCEPSGQLFADPYFGQVVRGVATALTGTRYLLSLLLAQDEAQRGAVDRHLLRGNADGVLLVSTRSDDPLPARLAEVGVPCVMAGRPAPGVRVAYVDADNEGGARLAVGHLLARGCRVVATVAGPPGMAAGADRLAGWRAALADAGLAASDELAATAPFTRDGGERATAELLARRPDVDGLFVASDLMALGALAALRRAGRRVPEDVALVGFDDGELAAAADPPLTTVRQPLEGLGLELVGALRAQMDATAAAGRGRPGGRGVALLPAPAAVVLRTELVVRASA